MKVGIISDTHMNKDIQKVEALLQKSFQEVDMIIHAGDYKNIEIIQLIKKFKPFVGVWGNIDDEIIRKLLNEKEIIDLKGYRIGIYHGHGTKKTTIERAYDQFKDDQVDIIIFGHSHQPIIKTMKGILMLNPGSITNKRKERWFSYITLDLSKNQISAKLNFALTF